jgi:4-amino-4-deoxy-L-arabinose transferase-like glycosyltransferase
MNVPAALSLGASGAAQGRTLAAAVTRLGRAASRTEVRRTLARGLLIAAVVAGYAAQVQLELHRLGSAGAALLYAAAIVLFVSSLRLSRSLATHADGAGSLTWRGVLANRRPLLLAAVAVAWMEVMRVSVAPAEIAGREQLVLALWLGSIGLFTVAFVGVGEPGFPAFTASGVWRTAVAARLELGVVAAVAGVAALLRFIALADVPYPFQGDEGSVGAAGLRILTGRLDGVFSTSWSDQPTLSFAPTAALIALFGPDIVGARAWSAIQGVVAVPLVYLLGKRMFARDVGLLAAMLLATWHLHIHFSRVAVNNGGDAFFALLVFWLVYRASATGRVTDYLWAGLAAGATWYSYVGTRLVFLLAVGFLAYDVLRQKRLPPAHWRGLLTFGGVVAVVAGPQLVFFQRHPDIFMARMSQVGIVQSGWLARESAMLGVPALHLVADHIRRAFLVFISLDAGGGFYNAPGPLLSRGAAVLFVLGLGYATLRLLDRRYLLLVVWFWSVVILGGAMTVDVPNAGRLMLAAPAVCLLIALGLRLVVDAMSRSGLLSATQGRALAGVVVVVIGLSSANFYFRRYAPGPYFADANTETSHVMGLYLRGLGRDYVAYFAGVPRVPVGFPSIPYLAPEVSARDLNEPISESTLPSLEARKRAVFLAIPERRSELEFIRERFPGGRWREFAARAGPEPLFFAYELPDS